MAKAATVHGMIPKAGMIYCHKLKKITSWTDDFFQKHCNHCTYFAGAGGGIDEDVVVECKYNDGSGNIAILVNDPAVAKLQAKSLHKSLVIVPPHAAETRLIVKTNK